MDNAIILLSAILGLKILEDATNIFYYWKAKPLTENGKKKRLINQFIKFKNTERRDFELKRSIVEQTIVSYKEDKANKQKLVELEKLKKKMNVETVKKLDIQIMNIDTDIKKANDVINEISGKIIADNQEIMAAKKVLKEVGKQKGITGKEYIAKMKIKEAEEKEKQLKEKKNKVEEEKLKINKEQKNE